MSTLIKNQFTKDMVNHTLSGILAMNFNSAWKNNEFFKNNKIVDKNGDILQKYLDEETVEKFKDVNDFKN